MPYASWPTERVLTAPFDHCPSRAYRRARVAFNTGRPIDHALAATHSGSLGFVEWIVGENLPEKACPEEGEQAMCCPECGCDHLLIQLTPDETTGECLECGALLVREEGGTLIPAPTS